MFILSIFAIGCMPKDSIDEPTDQIVDTSTVDSEVALTWEEYQLLFEYMVDNISITDLELKESTIGSNVTAVDRELTFDKRESLTLVGELSTKTTEEQIILEDANQTKQFTITVMYTDNYIGENMIGYPTNEGFNNLNGTLVNKATYSIFTYKNLVIVVHQVSIDKYDTDLMYSAMKSVVDLLVEYDTN